MNFGLKIPALAIVLNICFCGITMEIPMTLLEESGVTRNARIKSGIPLARGQVKDGSQIAIRDSAGNPIPARFLRLATHSDHSWKWVLAEFFHPMKAGEKKTLFVDIDSNRGRTAPSVVSVKKSGKYEISAGRLTATIPLDNFNLLEDIRIDGRQVGRFGYNGIALFDEKNQKMRNGSANVLEEGPGIFLATGRIQHPESAAAMMDYRVRIFFHPETPRIDFAVTLINTNLSAELSKFSQANIEFVPAVPIQKITTSANGHKVTVSKRIFQPNFDYLEIDGKTQKEADSSGAFQVETTDGKKFSLGIRNFRNRWPKGLSCNETSFSIELLPALTYKKFADPLPGYLKYNFDSGKYKIKWGMAFTEYFSLDFSEENSLDASAAEMNSPIIAVLPSDYYASTNAFFENGYTEEFFQDYDRMIEKALTGLEESRKRQKEYGFLNYGDWFGERRQNWGNNEYDLAKTLFYHFMRTGNRASFRRGIEAAEHQADSDIVHAYSDPAFIGANHLHSIGHTGHWTRPYWHYQYDAHTSAGNGHTWAQGLISAWFLGGSFRSRDGARELAGHINNHAAPNFKTLGTHERSAGWMLYAICSLYELDRDPKCLESARKLFQVIQAEQKKELGGWPHQLPKDHAQSLKDAYGNVPFLVGILLQGLRQYHLLTGDAEAKAVFLSGAEWLKKAYHPATISWPYAASPAGDALRETMPGLTPLIAPAMAYAARISGKPEFYRMSVRAMLGSWLFNNTGDGKSFAQSGVFAADFIADVSAFRRQFSAEAAVEMTLAELIADFPVSNFRVRGPERHQFTITPAASAKACELSLERLRHGARIDAGKEGNITIIDCSGKTVLSETFNLQEDFQRKLQLPGKNGAPFTISIEDNMTGVWNVSSEQASVKAELLAGFSIGGVGIARYYLRIPAGVESFEVNLTGVHPGVYGIMIQDNQAHTLKHTENYNCTGTQLPWAQDKGVDISKRIECRFKPEPAERFFSVYLWAAGDIGFNVCGIPAELYTKLPTP